MAQKPVILRARRSSSAPSDVTFREWHRQGRFDEFVRQHYDWWMFPWKATVGDSEMSREFSVCEGDVADLLLSSGVSPSGRLWFARQYCDSTNALFDAKRIGDRDPVHSASSRRKLKIYASLCYFERVASLLGFEADAAEFNGLQREFVRLFGRVESYEIMQHC